LLALPFRPVTAGCLSHNICGKYSQCVMPDTRKNPDPEGQASARYPQRGINRELMNSINFKAEPSNSDPALRTRVSLLD
jgi:hypothetical protein